MTSNIAKTSLLACLVFVLLAMMLRVYLTGPQALGVALWKRKGRFYQVRPILLPLEYSFNPEHQMMIYTFYFIFWYLLC